MADLLASIGGGFVLIGVALSVLGAFGILKFPDVYTRIHAASITDTAGASLVLLGLCLIAGISLVTLKLVFIWMFVMLTTPVAANALANAAFGSGHKPRIGAFHIMRSDERRQTPRGTDAP
ncbi:MAG: sodium:proton antiporter [Alphaproteobacteria bacterium]|jgi:multicomponent Na+:H+ antiporter subunit G|nr:MAG: sodium:proton antiporter [Alphaproteobacteria bacterium]